MVDKIDKEGIVIAPDGTRFQINANGEIVLLDGEMPRKKSEAEAARDAEYSELEYLINNHPDRLKDVDAARARRTKLEEEMGIDSKKSADAFAKAREKLRARINQKNNSDLLNIISQKKQND